MLAEALRRIWAPSSPPADLRALEAAHPGRALVTRNDQEVYGELDPLTEVYLLTAGTIRLFVGEGTARRTTLLLAAPALFGDRDLLAGCSVSQESACSISKATLLCYDRSELEAVQSDPQQHAQLQLDLLLRSARAARFAAYLAQPIEARVLWLLLEQAPAGLGELPPYENLALMADSAEKSIGRAVRSLQERGQLHLEGKRGFRVDSETHAEMSESGLLGLIHRLGAD